MLSRRQVLKDLKKQPTTHAGLWLDKFLPEQTEDKVATENAGKGAKGELIKELERHPMPPGYWQACELRNSAQTGPGFTVRTLKAAGRVVVGLGEKGVIEAGLRLEHTWGVPLLPGSALKGLAAATAEQLLVDEGWRKAIAEGPDKRPVGSLHKRLFGSTDETGAVAFHDAWWQPDSKDATVPFHLDTMTVHHPGYYQSSGADLKAPTDFDSPTPVAFATVSGSYRLVLEGPAEERDLALGLLQIGLMEMGIGAKTNAGYGRMTIEGPSSKALLEAAAERDLALAAARQLERAAAAEQARIARAAALAAEEEAKRKAQWDRLDAVVFGIEKNTAGAIVIQMLKEYAGPLRVEFARRAIRRLDTIDKKFLAQKKDKEWVKLLRAAAGE